MKHSYSNILGSERTVELEFMFQILQQTTSDKKILDVGGIPSSANLFTNIYNHINMHKLNYEICDHRGGKYQGDFVNYNFNDEKFDLIIFCSSLEHFPQCTEGDLLFREGEDRRGFEKALKTLNNKGKVLITVPFGKHIWQPYHQNYNWEGILQLTEGAEIIESYIYKLENSTEDKFGGVWSLVNEEETRELLYTDRAYACGCFLLEKK